MAKKGKQLSQAEVWDDSALVDSWNEALVEYKLYHSIHARGERVEDVLAAAEAEAQADAISGTLSKPTALISNIDSDMPEELEDGELEGRPNIVGAYPHVDINDEVHIREAATSQTEQTNSIKLADGCTAEDPHRPNTVPSTVTNHVEDEALKNLMMSWYYAGYYTGLFEGRQQANKNSSR